jgi:serine/threonine protein kinase/tetratricopeptide (TPR) repeat protein
MSTPRSKAPEAGSSQGAGTSYENLALETTLASTGESVSPTKTTQPERFADTKAGNTPGAPGTSAIELPTEIAAHTPGSQPEMNGLDGELPRGASIGRYIVLSALGAGGMGVVYAAYDPELDRKVAIKLLRPDAGAGHEHARVRLLREAQAMARLSHPNVIAVFDVGTLGEQVFIAMEFIDGWTLTKWLQQKPRSVREILDIFTLAGRGLEAAHRAGLVHRDFKPDNVLVSKDGQVRVMDFGLARRAGNDRDSLLDSTPSQPAPASLSTSNQILNVRLTLSGAMMGTPRYMAPEQYEGKKTDPRTDQFSFCVALFEALYGMAPFAGDDLTTLGFNVVRGRLLSPPPDTKVPTWVRAVVTRGLAVKPDDRFPSFEALLAALNPPRRKISKAWLVTAGVLILGIGAQAAYQIKQRQEIALCQNLERNLAGVWDPARKDEVKKSLLATGKEYAAGVWERVSRQLDTYATDWMSMRSEVCRAAVTGEQGLEIRTLRLRCLDNRREELKALTSLLSKADTAVAEQATTAIHDLPAMSDCADLDMLTAQVPIPDKPSERKKAEELTQRMTEARAFERFGKYSEVLSKAEHIAKEADQLGHGPTAAEAKFLLGEVQMRSGAAGMAEVTLRDAVADIIDSRRPHRLIELYILLTEINGFRLKKFGRAEVWSDLASALLKKLNDAAAERLRARLLLTNCMVRSQENQLDEALESCNKALELRTRLFGDDSPDVVEVLNVMAGVHRRSRRLDVAIEMYHRALALETRNLGSLHPYVASTMRGLGIVKRERQKYGEALQHFRQALVIQQQSLGPSSARLTDYHRLIALTLVNLNRLDEAETAAQQALSLAERAPKSEENTRRLADSLWVLSEVKAAQGQHEKALEFSQRGLTMRERERERREDLIAYPLTSVGESLLALNRPSEAQPYLERALSIREHRPAEQQRNERHLLGRTRFAMARAVWATAGKDKAVRQRAVHMAEQAQADFAAYGPGPDSELDEITAWLKDHTAEPGRRGADADPGAR